MEKFEMKDIIQKMIVETHGQLKQAEVMERFSARKAEGKEDAKAWSERRDAMQKQMKEKTELLNFLEEIKPDYE